MCLQEYLVEKFKCWKPAEPEVLKRTQRDITLCWSSLEPFHFLAGSLIFNIERYNKMPRWVVVYSGGKTTKTIDNLAPRHPHKFRLKVILKAEAVPQLAEKAIQAYGDERTVYEKFNKTEEMPCNTEDCDVIEHTTNLSTDTNDIPLSGPDDVTKQDYTNDLSADDNKTSTKKERPCIEVKDNAAGNKLLEQRKWLESQWSEETWTSTDTDGTSAVCFSMAVRCGYIKQVQSMLDERPELVGICNPQNGFTPLATAVRRGDMNMVRYLLSMGAEVDQASSAGQTPLHLAVFAANVPMAELLLDKAADFQARDWNGLRVEHYAVDSGDLAALQFVLDRGGDVHAQDNNGWTPLFRAVCQGARTALVAELVARGSHVDAHDRAGLPLSCLARIHRDTHGRSRDSILRLVDSNYPHEKALANFTRLTKKIYNVHSLLKLI